MAILGVDDFKSKLKGGGARPNLFKVVMGFPAYAGGDVELTSFLCKGANLPASTMGNIPVGFRGRQIQIAGDRTFEPWTVTIINDTDFRIRSAMERWMNGINAHSANTGRTNPLDYQADMEVQQLDKDETILYRYKFKGAFPTNVSAIDLAYDTNDTVEEFSVEFQIQYWESNATGANGQVE
jgi:hypothetical protein